MVVNLAFSNAVDLEFPNMSRLAGTANVCCLAVCLSSVFGQCVWAVYLSSVSEQCELGRRQLANSLPQHRH